ncbi:hypothetical protein FRC00_010166, partial [Tulasnella sp. 408]
MLFTTLLVPLALLALPASAGDHDRWRRPKRLTKIDQQHKVIVGGAAGLVYTPNVVYAEPGDTVRFYFQFKNHTVTQSSFDYPCTPLHGGFTSGFKPVAMDAKNSPQFRIKIDSYDPIWVHCEQVDHCPSGMVLGINPPKKGNTFDKFLKKAQALASHHYMERSEVDEELDEASAVEE